jgi:hypothetical protein
VLAQCWGHGRARQIFDWAERLRGQEFTRATGEAPAAPAIVDELADLRALELSNADASTKRFVRQHVERRIAARTRRATGSVADRSDGRFPVEEVLARLGDAAMLEFCVVGDTYRAVALHGGRARRTPIAAPVGEVDRHVADLQAALAELAAPQSRLSARQTAERAHASAAYLSRRLVEPCQIPNAPIVVVPTGGLHGLPWNALPACQGRPVSITPSAALWARCAPRVAPPDRVAVIVGPGLDHGQREGDQVVCLYGQATLLAGDSATSRNALDVLAAVDLVHVAAHGTFRSDNPLLSSIELDDGPLMVYDLERLDRLPGQVILSSCDLGLNRVVPGDELLGLTAALFAQGVHTVIAASQVVDDAAACELMIGYHERLRRGEQPARALAGAAMAVRATADRRAGATAAVFGCYGAGWSSPT